MDARRKIFETNLDARMKASQKDTGVKGAFQYGCTKLLQQSAVEQPKILQCCYSSKMLLESGGKCEMRIVNFTAK